MQSAAAGVIKASGGHVIGEAVHPTGSSDFGA